MAIDEKELLDDPGSWPSSQEQLDSGDQDDDEEPMGEVCGGQTDFLTILAIWNVMLGTSMFSIPWAMTRAGLLLGTAIVFLMGALVFYTSYRVVMLQHDAKIEGEKLDLPELMKIIIGRWGEIAVMIVTMFQFVGTLIVYAILLSDFLYNIVKSIHGWITESTTSPPPEVICPSMGTYGIFRDGSFDIFHEITSTSTFDKVWIIDRTAPIAVFAILFPLMNVPSPSFLVKFNALGPVGILYNLIFITVHSFQWGVHANLSDPKHISYIQLFTIETAHVLTGVLTLGLYSHNILIPILARQRTTKHYFRNIGIAYGLSTMTYLSMGLMFWISYPLAKVCIADNLLKNFDERNIMAFISRMFLFFQLSAIFPMVMFIIRTQVMMMIFKVKYPSWVHVFVLNALVSFICIMFAMFYPAVGTVIRYIGAACGMVLVYCLPAYAYMVILKRDERLTKKILIPHVLIMIFGVLNLILQALPEDCPHFPDEMNTIRKDDC